MNSEKIYNLPDQVNRELLETAYQFTPSAIPEGSNINDEKTQLVFKSLKVFSNLIGLDGVAKTVLTVFNTEEIPDRGNCSRLRWHLRNLETETGYFFDKIIKNLNLKLPHNKEEINVLFIAPDGALEIIRPDGKADRLPLSRKFSDKQEVNNRYLLVNKRLEVCEHHSDDPEKNKTVGSGILQAFNLLCEIVNNPDKSQKPDIIISLMEGTVATDTDSGGCQALANLPEVYFKYGTKENKILKTIVLLINDIDTTAGVPSDGGATNPEESILNRLKRLGLQYIFLFYINYYNINRHKVRNLQGKEDLLLNKSIDNLRVIIDFLIKKVDFDKFDQYNNDQQIKYIYNILFGHSNEKGKWLANLKKIGVVDLLENIHKGTEFDKSEPTSFPSVLQVLEKALNTIDPKEIVPPKTYSSYSIKFHGIDPIKVAFLTSETHPASRAVLAAEDVKLIILPRENNVSSCVIGDVNNQVREVKWIYEYFFNAVCSASKQNLSSSERLIVLSHIQPKEADYSGARQKGTGEIRTASQHRLITWMIIKAMNRTFANSMIESTDWYKFFYHFTELWQELNPDRLEPKSFIEVVQKIIKTHDSELDSFLLTT